MAALRPHFKIKHYLEGGELAKVSYANFQIERTSQA